MKRATTALALLALATGLAPGPLAAQAPGAAGMVVNDVTGAAGVRFRHTTGAFGKKYLPETMGSGLALLDFDRDGWLDVFFVNGTRWPGRPGAPTYPALYRNDRDGTFSEVTKAAGLAVRCSAWAPPPPTTTTTAGPIST